MTDRPEPALEKLKSIYRVGITALIADCLAFGYLCFPMLRDLRHPISVLDETWYNDGTLGVFCLTAVLILSPYSYYCITEKDGNWP